MQNAELLGSFDDKSRAAVIGASGGIGRAITERLVSSGRFSRVYAASRSQGADPKSPQVKNLHLDYASPDTLAQAAADIEDEGPLDFVFVATGILHDGDAVQPEKSMRDIERESLEKVFAVNTFGPVLVAQHFLPLMRRKGRSVFAALSARVGSIGDNRLGGWLAYRSSKAALNMALKTLSIEHARRHRDSVVVALHPGTVETGLSQPFTGNVPDGKLFSPATAAGHLLGVIDGLDSEDTGGFFAWDGKPIAW